MCIQNCDDGNSSGCEAAVAFGRQASFEKLVAFLNYEIDAPLSINRDDTLEYLLWYPANWMTETEAETFFCLNSADERHKEFRYKK